MTTNEPEIFTYAVGAIPAHDERDEYEASQELQDIAQDEWLAELGKPPAYRPLRSLRLDPTVKPCSRCGMSFEGILRRRHNTSEEYDAATVCWRCIFRDETAPESDNDPKSPKTREE